MAIARLTAHHVRIPLKRTVRHASHTRDDTDSILIRCELNDGSVGWGEGLPREYVTGESIDDAWQLLQVSSIAEQLSVDLSDPASAVAALDKLQLSTFDPQPSTRRDCFGNSVRCAIEIAVLDAACRSRSVPLGHVTEPLTETLPIRRQSAEVRYSGAITAMSPWQTIHSAFKQRVYGFQQVKVKVGLEGNDDAALLKRIRRVLGKQVDLRVDANEAWSCDNLEERLASLQPFGISSVEQPVPHDQVGGLAAIRDRLGIPIILDESLCSLTDGQRAIDEGLCDLFNIRLSKCGGFLPSLRLAAMAHAAGLGYQLGCQVGETGILSAAGRHFATSVGGIRYLEGSYDRHLVREWLTIEDVTFGYGGRAPALDGPGLGVTIDEEAVRRVSQRELNLV